MATLQSQPSRKCDLTHLAVTVEHLLGEALIAVFQLEAIGKPAWPINWDHARSTALQLARNESGPLHYERQDRADALGFLLVHTNKTTAKLRDAGVLDWSDGRLSVFKPTELARLAPVTEPKLRKRPRI